MSTTRFSAAQLVEGVSRSAQGGDPRYFLLLALSALRGEEADEALIRLGEEIDLQAGEWFTASRELANRRPETYLSPTIQQGLKSRSIQVQQSVIVELPVWAGKGLLGKDHLDLARRWLDKRLKNPRRKATADTWEVVDVALAIAIVEGPKAANTALIEWARRLLADERQKVAALPPPSSVAFIKGLQTWSSTNKFDGDDPSDSYEDPTATRYIDRVMGRLKIEPLNPQVEVFVESWESFEPPTVNEFSSEPVSDQLARIFGSPSSKSENLGTETRP